MQLWTYEHAITVLPGLAIMAVLAVVLRKFLKEKPHHIRMIPISVIAVILVLLEIGKQTLSFRRGYDLYHIPLHFCSLFIFMLPLASFYRGKYQQKVQAIKQLQEEYELSDKTILDGMKAISENKTIKFENGDEFTFTLTHLLLRSDLEKTATLLVRKAEELATKKPVSDKLKTFVKITDM